MFLVGKRHHKDALLRYIRMAWLRSAMHNKSLWRVGPQAKVSFTYSPVLDPKLEQVSIDDRGVRSAWGIQYHYELQEYGIETELEIYDGDDHVFKGDVLEQAIQADLKFFRSHMQP